MQISGRVLVVEDDALLRGQLSRGLREHGMVVTAVGTGGAAVALFGATEQKPTAAFDVVLLDIGLPDSDGRDVCQALRARGVLTPVIFLTARGQLTDVLSGFAAGGDEYLAKPFHFPELLARAAALLRRADGAGPGPASSPDGLRLDPSTHRLTCGLGDDATSARLTPTEFRLLAALLAAVGQVVRRRDLVRAGWPDGAVVHDNTLDQYLAKLRRKLRTVDPSRAIVTAHGVGYEFR
jgi:DNA-binding response OmpR family regulator